MGRGKRENGVKITRNKKYKWLVENTQGEVKNTMGNGKAKELICTTHGHDLRGGSAGGRGQCRAERNKGEKKMGRL